MPGMVVIGRKVRLEKEDLDICGMVPKLFYQTGKHLGCWLEQMIIILTTLL